MAPQTPGAVHVGGQTQPAHQQSAINTRTPYPLPAGQDPSHQQLTARRTTETIRYQRLFCPYPQCCLSQRWTNTPVCHDPQPLLQAPYQYLARPSHTCPWGLSRKAVPRFDPEMFLPVLVAGYRREHAAAGEPARLLLGSGDSMSRIRQRRLQSQT